MLKVKGQILRAIPLKLIPTCRCCYNFRGVSEAHEVKLVEPPGFLISRLN